MVILHDPQCAEYGSYLRPEQPARVLKTVPFLRAAHPGWEWRVPVAAGEADLLLAHTPAHLKRLRYPSDFDDDTPYFEGIYDHARRSVGAALAALDLALVGRRAFALMRPPGHHATADEAMGFCYLNQIAIAALVARAHRGVGRVAVWDFDAHHGNGTEALLREREGFLFVSVHQYPGYPGTGTESFANCRNFPVAPGTSRAAHRETLARSWEEVVAFQPDIVLVSAGFDAYVNDPITTMTLEIEDFSALGGWIRSSGLRAAAVLEGGYSNELPRLVEAFLTGWVGEGATA
ncbi:MAG TPA: histone deacetylase [Opitutaceae bacterium]